jgi:gamma-glutamyltranspeptidase/glutathione hydrolase
MIREVARSLSRLSARMLALFERRPRPGFTQSAERPTLRQGGHVVCYHPQARAIGEAILDAGGNAFDAFVAATAAENVLSEGASSLAGALGVLVYRADSGLVTYLDANHNDPLLPAAWWTEEDPAEGKAALVPGAPAALEALAAAHGRLPLPTLLAPAIALADAGFPVCRLMAATIRHRAGILRRSDYGRDTYLPNGNPLQPGDTLRQPVVADWLRGFAEQGADYVYHGAFGQRFIETVQANGGLLDASDLAAYREQWHVPWSMSYRGVMLRSCSGCTYGGLWTLLALKTLEHAAIAERPHYSRDADALERMLRVARAVWSERFLFEGIVEDDPAAIQARLSPEYTATIFERAAIGRPDPLSKRSGTHSFHIIAIDDEGNIASGTTTAQSEPWGDGIFVEGLPLTTSGRLPFARGPGRRRLSPFSIHLALRDGRPLFSLGAISNSVVEAAFQLIVNLIDYRLPLHDAVRAPRFGTFPPDRRQRPRLDRNWIDPDVEPSIVAAVRAGGLKLHRSGVVDTGLGAVLALQGDHTSEGATLPLAYLARPFSVAPLDQPDPQPEAAGGRP